MKMLSKNFSMEELTASETAARKGIDNTPSPMVESNLKSLAVFLEEIRALVGYPITVSSGYRSVALNKAVGGVSNSDHIDGRAADIKCSRFTPYEFAKLISRSTLKYDQVILEYDSWVHVSISSKPRRQSLTYRKGFPTQVGIIPK